MKILRTTILLLALTATVLPANLPAQVPDYQLLEPSIFPEAPETIKVDVYFTKIYQVALSAAVILAFLMLVIAGIQYTATGVSESAKTDAKKRFQEALTGLLLALGSWLILNTINPQLAKPSALAPTGGGEVSREPPPAEPTGPPTSGQACIDYWRPKQDGMNVYKTSPLMQQLIDYVRQKMGADASKLGAAYTFEQSQPWCNDLVGVGRLCGITCQHRALSRHYGRQSFCSGGISSPYCGSNAVDFTMGSDSPDNSVQYGDRVIGYAREFTASRGMSLRSFCEPPGGGSVACSSGLADHIHIEI